MNNILKKLNLPDYLSIFRIIAAIALVVLAIYGLRLIFAWLLLIGLITDALDGYIARKRNIITKHGAFLDSIGDFCILLGAYLGIIIFETGFFEQHLTPFLIVLGFYFLQLILALWRYGRPSSFHTYSAKAAAVLHGFFLVSTGFFGPLEWLFYLAICISIFEAVEEIILLFLFKDPVTDVKGLYCVLKDGKDSFK